MKKRGLIYSVIFHTAAVRFMLIVYIENEELPNKDVVSLEIVYKSKQSPQKVIPEKIVALSKSPQKKIYNEEISSLNTAPIKQDSLRHLNNLKLYNTFQNSNSVPKYNFNKYWVKKLTDEEVWWEVVKKNLSFVILNKELQDKYDDKMNKWKFRTNSGRAEPQINFRLHFVPYSDRYHNGGLNKKMNSGGISLPISETVKSIIDLF